MKNGKLIMLPLLSATFLLSCNGTNANSVSSDKSENTSTSDSSDSKHDDIAEIDADKNLEVLKQSISNTVSKNGFKAVASPIKTSVAGKKYSSSVTDPTVADKTDWDAIINVGSLTYASTHLNDEVSIDGINETLKIDNLSIKKNKYGIAPLVSDKGQNALNKLIESMSISENVYYAGSAYTDRVYFDDYNKKGEESDTGLLVSALTPAILKGLDSAGYSVYENDDPLQEAKYSIQPTGYIETSNVEDIENDTFSITEITDLVLDYLDGKTIDFNDNLISIKTYDTYKLMISFSSKDVNDLINDFIDSLDDDWKFTLPVEEDNPFSDIVVTKEPLKTISEKISDNLKVKKFDYSIDYSQEQLLSTNLDFDLTIDESVYDDIFKEKTEDGSEATQIGVSSLNFSSSVSFSTYEKTAEDSDEEKLKEHLWSFAELPSKEDLADENKYPNQPLPEKKEETK